MVSGIGFKRAEAAAEALIEAGCHHLISWGSCVALNNSLQTGDVIMAESMLLPSGRINLSTLESITSSKHSFPLVLGNMTNAETILDTQQKKQALHAASGAIAADMESSAIALLAKKHDIPCTVIRAVSDTLDMSLPLRILEQVDPYGDVHLPGLTFALLKKPSDLFALIKLGRGFNKAMRNLNSLSPLILT